MTILMLARRAREQEAVFQRRGLGEPFGTQLAGKRLGIVGMGNIGAQAQPCKTCHVQPMNNCLIGQMHHASSRLQ